MGEDRPRLGYVVLFCQDLEASLGFYRDRLGLPAVQESPSFVLLQAGPVRLGLHAARDGRRTSGVHLHFDTPDVEAAAARLRARGVALEGEVRREPWGARAVRTRDPDGNAVEFVQWD